MTDSQPADRSAMQDSLTTCWTVIESAAAGGRREREAFAKTYLPVVRAYLIPRWSNSSLKETLEDAIQEVFVECFRSDGPLARADRERDGGFRAFLFGVVRNVARRFEEKGYRHQHREVASQKLEDVATDETELSKSFDRAWAKAIMKQAGKLQLEKADGSESALQRVKLLRLRFQEGRAIRDIAYEWEVEPAYLHREYAKARVEFRAALTETIEFHRPNGTASEIQQECVMLLELLR